MILEKILSDAETPSDVLQVFAYTICATTGAKGAFVSTETMDYMDVVVGSMKRRRSSLAKDGVSVSEIRDIKKGERYNYKGILIYRTEFSWYVGVDSPEIDDDFVEREINAMMNSVYPAYNLSQKCEENITTKDKLTGCYNRTELFTHLRSNLKTMLTKDIPLYVFYMDFNNFKVINDTLGHNFGDKVLASVGSEIRGVFFGYGNVYRAGGDEFIGVCFGITKELAEKIAKRIETVTRQAPCGLFVSVSVAYKEFKRKDYVYYNNQESMDKALDAFLSDVEENMYQNKKDFTKKHGKPDILCDLCPYRKKFMQEAY